MRKEINNLKRQLWTIANSRNTIKLKIQFYQDLISDFSIGGVKLDGMPKGNKVPDPTYAFVERMEFYQTQIIVLIDELNNEINEFNSLINNLDETEKQIIILRHLKGIRWEYIEQFIPYSRRQAINIYNRALRTILKSII